MFFVAILDNYRTKVKPRANISSFFPDRVGAALVPTSPLPLINFSGGTWTDYPVLE